MLFITAKMSSKPSYRFMWYAIHCNDNFLERKIYFEKRQKNPRKQKSVPKPASSPAPTKTCSGGRKENKSFKENKVWLKGNKSISESSLKNGWSWIISSKTDPDQLGCERWLTEHSYSPRLEHETFFLMPSFHYEAERWRIQFVIDPKSFAERHSPFFRGSPVKTKQSKANEANVSFCSKGLQGIQKSLPARFWWGGGVVKKKKAGEAWGENGWFQKISRHLILPKSKRKSCQFSQQGKTGFYHSKSMNGLVKMSFPFT